MDKNEIKHRLMSKWGIPIVVAIVLYAIGGIFTSDSATELEPLANYETGITYEQISRRPYNYSDKKIKFTGRVLQVLEGGEETQVRLAVNNNSKTTLYCYIPKKLTKNNRILENDFITIYGTSVGVKTYETIDGRHITIPGARVDGFKFYDNN